MIDNGKGEGLRLRHAVKGKAQDAEEMPVAHKAGTRGDGDADHEDDQDDEGGDERKGEVKGLEHHIDGKCIDEPEKNGQRRRLREQARFGHHPEAVDELVEEPVRQDRIAPRQPVDQGRQQSQTQLAPEEHEDHEA